MSPLLFRSIALALLLWSAGLSGLATLALAEEFHQHDHSVPCAQSLLIEHWYQAIGTSEYAFVALGGQPLRFALKPYAAPVPAPAQTGNRDPPPLPLFHS
ncbi:hypothetical protein [Ferrimonas pelagia]|uniref:Uncharacterized protein n=1 Tax=Ferrimonas pelagia TaxID=1177826 RepID=A0ABP9EJQ7_9GAMM